MNQNNVSKIGVKRLRLSTNQKHYLNEETKDITFVVKGIRIPAHKVILSSCSEVFERLIYNKNEDKDLMDLKDTTPDVFKYLLKLIYLEQFDANDLNNNHIFVIEVYKLALRLDIKTVQTLMEEELIKMIDFKNFMPIIEFAANNKLSKLLETVNEFTKDEKQISESIEKFMRSEQIENIEKCIQILGLSQKQIIHILDNISKDNEVSKNLHKYRPLIKLDLCSVKDIISLRNTRLFEDKELDKLIDVKLNDLDTRYNLLDTRCQKLTDELREKTEHSTRLALQYNELNRVFTDFMAHYKEIKEIFEPFVEGVGGRVNQYVFTKSNCYFGKIPKKFCFKY